MAQLTDVRDTSTLSLTEVGLDQDPHQLPGQCSVMFFIFLQQHTRALRQGLQLVYVNRGWGWGYIFNEKYFFYSYVECLRSLLSLLLYLIW